MFNTCVLYKANIEYLNWYLKINITSEILIEIKDIIKEYYKENMKHGVYLCSIIIMSNNSDPCRECPKVCVEINKIISNRLRSIYG